MSGIDWERVQAIFLAALDVTPAERPSFLSSTCGGEAELRAEVESLLAADSAAPALVTAIESEARSLLEVPALLGAAAPRLYPYAAFDYFDSDTFLVLVIVAFREIYGAHSSVTDFANHAVSAQSGRHERQILADLDHPYIARLPGTTPDGRPFFVMEHVEGRPIEIYCREEGLDLEARLRLFLCVCEAVSSAHRSLGKQVYVEGRLQTRSYEDRDGVKRYVTEIVDDGVILLGGQGGSQDQPASGKSNNNGLVSQPRGHVAAPRRARLLLMIPVASRLQTTTSLLIRARAVSDLTRAYFRPLTGRGVDPARETAAAMMRPPAVGEGAKAGFQPPESG